MKLQDRDLSINMCGEDVAILHSFLRLLDYNIPPDEKDRQYFGRMTKESVADFQQKHRLGATGIVNECAATALGAAVDGLQPRRFLVRGHLRLRNSGTLPPGIIVRAYDQDLREQQPLGEDNHNPYEMIYAAEQFRRAERGTADIVIKAFSADGTELGASEILFNAPTVATIDLLIASPDELSLSEYERDIRDFRAPLDGLELADLSSNQMRFLEGETGKDRQRVEFHVNAVRLARDTGISAAVFYACSRKSLPRELKPLLEVPPIMLRRAVASAVSERIVPAIVGEMLDEIMTRLEGLRIQHAPPVAHELTGQLLHQDTGAPLNGLTVRAFDLDAGTPPTALGYDITNGRGLFALVYPVPAAAVAGTERNLRFDIADRSGAQIHQTAIVVKSGETEIVEVRVPGPAVQEPPSPTLEELSATVHLDFPLTLRSGLAAHGILTLADVRKTGGMSRLNLGVAPNHPTVMALEAYANLSLLSSDLQVTTALIGKGFTSITSIAQALRTDFVSATRKDLGDFKAAQTHGMARAMCKYFDNIVMEVRSAKVNGFDHLNIPAPPPTATDPFSTKCSCEDCEAAVSPLAYLADLLDYAVRHVQNGGAAINLQFLTDTFHQLFGDLPAACEEMDRQVRQVRICIEVLRSYLKVNPPTGPKLMRLTNQQQDYLVKTYTTLLNKLGTSYEDIRLARTAEVQTRQALAERLGFDSDPEKRDPIRALFLDAATVSPGPAGITELMLEQLFGLADTTRDPLSEGAKLNDPPAQITRWRFRELEWGRHTDEAGMIYVRLKGPPQEPDYKVELYKDRPRTLLVASGNRPSATGVVELIEYDGSGLSGTFDIAYVSDSDAIVVSAVPRVLSWRLRHLRTFWRQQDSPADPFAEGRTFEVLPILPSGLQFPASLGDRIAYDVDDELLIFRDVMMEGEKQILLGLSTESAYQKAVRKLYWNSQRAPIIDPDVIGPDDFRVPFAKADPGDDDRSFDIWLNRRFWVDARLTEMAEFKKPASHRVVLKTLPEGLQFPAPLQDKITHDTIHGLLIFTGVMSEAEKTLLLSLSPDPSYQNAVQQLSEASQSLPLEVPELKAILDSLYGLDVDLDLLGDNLIKGPEVADTTLVIQSDLHLTVESFSRLMQIRAKDRLSEESVDEQPVSDEEWEELYSILVQAKKLMQFPEWRSEETSKKILLGSEAFWISLREPKEGSWPPILPSPTDPRPLIDPDIIKLKELPETMAGRRAISLREARQRDLQNITDALRAERETNGFDAMADLAFGPNPSGTWSETLQTLGANLLDDQPEIVADAKQEIENDLHLTVEEFTRLMEVVAKTDPDTEEWAEVYAILTSSQKRRERYNTWIGEEQQFDLSTAYWRAFKAALPRWRATPDSRVAWQQALRARSRPSVIDPDLIGLSDLRDPIPGHAALDLWQERHDKIQIDLQTLQTNYTAAATPMAALDSLLVEVFFGEATTSGVQGDLKAIRETAALDGVLKYIWGDPLPDLDGLLTDLTGGAESLATTARRTIASSLFLNGASFQQFMSIRSKVIAEEPVTDAEWELADGVLSQATLVKSLASLLERRDQGEGIEGMLDQLSLPVDALIALVRLRDLLASNSTDKDPLLVSEREELFSILLQVQKCRTYAQWRRDEQAAEILLGPDDFQIPEPPPLEFPPKEPEPLPLWRSTRSDRLDWQDTLQSRIDQQQAVIQAAAEVVGSTEEEVLPLLRNALILATGATGDLNAKAKWVTDRHLIDAQADGCQKTTRIAQAIETVQVLLFSLRTRQLNDTYPDLDLNADHFDEEWEWIGSYPNYRAAMFVFIYPENILIPSLRQIQTPGFKEFVSGLRSNRRLTPEQACEAAGDYAEYYEDICKLKLAASCTARTRIHNEGKCCGKAAAEYRCLFYVFGLGGVSNSVYWSAHDPQNGSGYAQTFWAKLTALENVQKILGAVSCRLGSGERYIFLFVRAQDKGKVQLKWLKYDLETQNWDGEPVEPEVPDNVTSFSALLVQQTNDSQKPHIVISGGTGAVYNLQIDAEGADFDDAEPDTRLDGALSGSKKMLAMVDLGANRSFLFMRDSTSGTIQFRYFDNNESDPRVRDLGQGDWIGAFRWPQTDKVYAFWRGLFNFTFYRVLSPESIPWIKVSTILEFDHWLDQVRGISLGDISADSLKSNITSFAPPSEPDYLGVSLLEFLTSAAWRDKLKSDYFAIGLKLIDAFGGGITFALAKVKFPEWQQANYDVWGNSYPPVGIHDALWHLFSEQSIQLRDLADETSIQPENLSTGWDKIAVHCDDGLVKTETKLVAYQRSGGRVGLWRSLFRRNPTDDHLTEIDPTRIVPYVAGPFDIAGCFSETELQLRRQQIKAAFQVNESAFSSNLTYIQEAYYFVPVHVGLQLQSRGQYIAALDWFRSVYDYSVPLGQRKIYHGLAKESTEPFSFHREEDWLLDPLNPHAIAATRQNTYTRFTILSIIRCLLEFADAEFTRDTAESVPRARTLYMTALELLETAELNQKLGQCEELIGTLEIEVGDAQELLVQNEVKKQVSGIQDFFLLGPLVESTKAVLSGTGNWATKFAAAKALIAQAKAKTTPPPSFSGVMERRDESAADIHTMILSNPAIATSTVQIGLFAAHNFLNTVSLVSGATTTSLENGKLELPWLAEKIPLGDGVGHGVQLPSSAVRKDYKELTFASPTSPSNISIVANFAISAPLYAIKLASGISDIYIPAPAYDFCVPPNPVLKALRLHAELNLYKLRTCRNIAGMERQLEPYAAPTDTVSGLPMIGVGGQLVLPGLAILRPTPYRYPVLIERAKQLVGLAQQVESGMLSALEKADAERYSLLNARNDMRLARADVRLKDLLVKQAEGGVKLAELQQEKAQIQADHFKQLLDEGLSVLEISALALLDAAAGFQLAAANLSFAASALSGTAATAEAAAHLGLSPQALSYGAQSISEAGGRFSSLASANSTMSQILSSYAGYERRAEEWEFQRTVALEDVRIGAQQVKNAQDQVRIAGQERQIAQIKVDHAQEVISFLSNKFTNVDLYDWMSDVLERVYKSFLQQGTAVARLAEGQLAFERQEVPPASIQDDYSEAPVEGAVSVSPNEKAPDRRGLTGSARLLQDIYQLDQYAFETNKRKLQLTKTISLARLAPIEFQQFRETGVITFATPMTMWDRDFPGHYLRLIRRVRTSVVALIPPIEGIRATLSTTGTSRVVIGGDVFQTVIRNTGPQSVALTSPRDATGLFELEPQSEMLVPFEGIGVDTIWEYRMLKAANPIDYRSIADVLLTIEYTALDSFDYRQQVMQTLKPTTSGSRPFSFRHQFADQWYDLHNPDQTVAPMTVRFHTSRDDFPPNLDSLKIGQIALYFARAGGSSFEVPVTQFRFTDDGGQGSVGGGSTSIDGIISTLKGNAGSWMAMIGKNPVGEWDLALPNTPEIRNHFKNEGIEDILFVLTFSGRTPEWPL